MLSSSCLLENGGGWSDTKKRGERTQTRQAAVRAIVQLGAESMFLMQGVRSLFTCLNSSLNLDVNTTLGEALQAENTTYKVLSDRCIQRCLPLSPRRVVLHLL